MAFDVKRNWPIIAAVLLVIVAIVEYRTAQGGTGYQLAGGGVDPSQAADYQAQLQANAADVSANRQAAVGIIGQLLSYWSAQAQTAAGNYRTFVGASAYGYGQTQQAEIAADYYATSARIAQLQRPSFLQQLSGFVNSLANAYSAYTTGVSMNRGGGYGNYGGRSIGSLPTLGGEYGAGTLSAPVPTLDYGGGYNP